MPLSEDDKKAIEQQKIDSERIIHRAAAFQRVFQGEDGELALKELALQCNANTSLISGGDDTYDPIKLAYRAGGRDLWTFIQNLLNFDVEKHKELLKNAGS